MKLTHRPGFSFLDMMMYLSLLALSFHYAIPCYQQLVMKMKAQELIKLCQQAQLQISEYSILQGSLPSEFEFSVPENSTVSNLSWSGQSLEATFSPSHDHQMHLSLQANLEDFGVSWSCEAQGLNSLELFVCYALT